MEARREVSALEKMNTVSHKNEAPPYSALATGYDVVMAHVEYDAWAAYVFKLIQTHHPQPRSVLELGCGTGSLALRLQPMGFDAYLATDGSPAMVREAQRKAASATASVVFEVADFSTFEVAEPVEVVLLLYDGMNYLLEPQLVSLLFQRARAALSPGGLFICDQSTPANSINNADYFEDEGRVSHFEYRRHSTYDDASRLHITTFLLTVDGRSYCERHVQRAYDLGEIRRLGQEAGFEECAAYDGFSEEVATEASERIHWVWRRSPETP